MVEPPLLDHGVHVLIEQSVLSSRERFGGEYNDWELMMLGLLPEILNDRKAVQAWHEQIQQDDIRPLLGDRIQGLLAIRRGHYLVRFTFEELAHQVDDLWVIIHY
jgi:hypothetical protein